MRKMVACRLPYYSRSPRSICTHVWHFIHQSYTALPPSTSILTPVTNADSSDAKKRQAPATSFASHKRPSGTLAMNLALFSGVSGMPEKASNLQKQSRQLPIPLIIPTETTHSPVPPRRGQTELTRMLWGPNSAASPLVACPQGSALQELA